MPPAPIDQPDGALFAELRSSGDPNARSALVERHLPLARRLAARYRSTPQPLEDLIQVASLGLLKAVDAFDPTRGVSFPAFAVPTILGELKRHIRDTAWTVHVPRALQERALAAEHAERALAARSGAPPTVGELATEAGMSEEEVLEAFAIRLTRDAVPLDTVAPADPSPAGPAFSDAAPDPELENAEDRLSLSDALRALPRRERTILHLRFVEDLTQSEIAERVGLSQIYVSRLLRAALETLRSNLD
jgi:RNA polymerase sigma-B factor